MTKRWIAATLICLALTMYAVGAARTTLWVYCQSWHATHHSQIDLEHLKVSLPPDWCPVSYEDGLTLAMVPPARNRPVLVVVVQPMTNDLWAKMRNPEAERTILGEFLRLSEPPAEHHIAGMSALRVAYERADPSQERVIFWSFPDEHAMALGFRVTKDNEPDFDRLVMAFSHSN